MVSLVEPVEPYLVILQSFFNFSVKSLCVTIIWILQFDKFFFRFEFGAAFLIKELKKQSGFEIVSNFHGIWMV